MFTLNAKFDAELWFYSLSHFECDNHTVHMLTQPCLPPSLTSIVKLSLLMHVHSSPLPLAARLHQCHACHSCYINNDWTFSGHTLCIWNVGQQIIKSKEYRDSFRDDELDSSDDCTTL